LHEVESFIYGLIDVLLAKGILSSEELSATVQVIRDEAVKRGEAMGAGVAIRLDPDDAPEAPDVIVNCAERMPICHSICCKLDFPLTANEIESGAVRWDLGRPYHIRHNAQGYCTHRDSGSGFCGVYDKRPGICRGYSCANDTRIWKDFERMELNSEWLDEHLSGDSSPRMLGAMLYQIEPAPRAGEARPN
jgi:Fe-S-cluster containining protein